ncbi:MAG: serine/threonine protein kinase [Anaerolineaceae bacterium]|jgi:serine/threonine-protein kinase
MATLAGQTLLGRYFLRELVGSGGMADVYLAWDQLRNAKMAVKVLRRDLGTNSRFFDRFANEADILRKLEHPNIVRLFEYEQDDGIAFIVMQWVEGSNLRQVLTNSHQPLSLADSSRVLESVCSALHYAHENKIYHCDIKPANIMLDIKGNTFDTLLADFGVAQLADTSGGGGTPTYMAPEQFTGDPIDARTDVYALGVTLFEVLTGGTTPYRGLAPSSEGSTTKERIAWEHLNCQPPSLLAINPNYSPAMEKVILTAMQKQPDKRFPSALSFYDAYEKARSTLPKGTISGGSDYKSLLSRLSSSATTIANVALDKLSESVQQATVRRETQGNAQKQSTPPPTQRKEKQSSGLQVIGRGSYLFCRAGLWTGQRIPVPLGETSIGRGSQAQIKLQDGTVSRRHASLIRTSRAVYIRDDGSSYGTFVNGRRIYAPTLLKERDVIQIGAQQVFEYVKG